LIPITPANLHWDADQPRADDFDDIYYSRDGVQETLRVFIEPSGIIDRARAHRAMCVAELGFGTGLNFAVCADRILQESSARLHYISFEKHPLRPLDWQRVLQLHGASPIYLELLKQPLPLLSGWHQRVLAGGRVTLQVFHGDALQGLRDLATRQANPVDAWFLDGFAPAKNPHMWDADIYPLLAQMAHRQTTVATFTAAGRVRRGLSEAGFVMRKVDQQPIKRESLAGYYGGVSRRTAFSPAPQVTVHGAGIAGACVARHLAEADIAVRVQDPHGIASGASGIGATVLHARLLGDGTSSADLRAGAFHYAASYLRSFAGFDVSGVMQAQGPNLDAAKLQRISNSYAAADPNQHAWIQHVSASDACEIAGVPVTGDALYYRSAGTVRSVELCTSLLAHPNIDVVATTDFNPDACNVVCAATNTRSFPGCELLEVVDVYGQLDWYESTAPVAKCPVVGNGFLVPTVQGCVLGASYEYTPWLPEQATEHNYASNAHYLPAMPVKWVDRSRGARCVASDREPVVGTFSTAGAGAGSLWLATGFGSMGTTVGPLAGAMVAAELGGWLPALDPAVAQLMRPARFAERQARRGIRHIEPWPGNSS